MVWEYTGTGPDNGYVQKSLGDTLTPGTGFFIRVYSNVDVQLLIPPDNNGGHFSAQSHGSSGDTMLHQSQDEELPPPPPGAQPAPDIKANGQDGPVVVSHGDSVSVSVSLDPGTWSGRNADWWVAAYTPFDSPLNWFTYGYPEGWRAGLQVGVQMPLFEFSGPLNVLNMVLPMGDYTFYFAVDGNMDGKPDVTWMDSVEVLVE